MATQKQIEQGKKNLEKYGKATQFSGSSAAENGRKGAYAKAASVRKKNTFRNNLKWMLTVKPVITPKLKKQIIEAGYDPDAEYTIEDLITINAIRRALYEDRSVDMVYRYLEEDPITMLEEKRLQVERDAVKAIRNSDGFMEAISKKAEEVFEDGGDTPDALEDE